MRKILFLLAMLPMMFACSSSDDEPTKEQFQFIQVKLSIDKELLKEPYIALFYGWKGNLTTSFTDETYDKILSFGRDGSDEYVFAVSGQYAEKMKKSNGLYIESFYADRLSSMYGSPEEGGQFAVSIYLEGEPHQKIINVTKNTKIEAEYKSSTKSVNWNVSDYE